MQKRESLILATLISITPAAIALWLAGAITALIVFALFFIGTLTYARRQMQRKPHQVLEILLEQDKQQLHFSCENDHISTLDLNQYPSTQDAILQEFNNKKATFIQMVNKVCLINIDDRALETQLNQQLASS